MEKYHPDERHTILRDTLSPTDRPLLREGHLTKFKSCRRSRILWWKGPILSRIRRIRQTSPHALMARKVIWIPPYLLPNNQCDTLHTREPSTQCPLKLSLQPTGNSSRVLLSRVCPNANLTSLTGTSPFSVKKAGTDDDSQGNINTKCTSAPPVDISAAKDHGSISTERIISTELADKLNADGSEWKYLLLTCGNTKEVRYGRRVTNIKERLSLHWF